MTDTPPSSPDNNKWLNENWDKLLFGIIGLVASGTAGFFGGTYSVRNELSQLSIAVNKNTTEIAYIKPRSERVPDLLTSVDTLRNEIEGLKTQNIISAQTRELISQKDDLIRQYTLEALMEIVANLESN